MGLPLFNINFHTTLPGLAVKRRTSKFRDSEAQKVGFGFLICFPRSVILITLGMRDRGTALWVSGYDWVAEGMGGDRAGEATRLGREETKREYQDLRSDRLGIYSQPLRFIFAALPNRGEHRQNQTQIWRISSLPRNYGSALRVMRMDEGAFFCFQRVFVATGWRGTVSKCGGIAA